jgi:DNA polymerase-3 subunit chi
MTRIDFYVLKPGAQGDRFALTCRLVERIYAQGRSTGPLPGRSTGQAQDRASGPPEARPGARSGSRRILIHCPDRQQASHLDQLLWTYREDSFLPHGLVGHTDPELTPILISTDGQPDGEDQVLINLAAEVPEFFSRFERLCEPLDNDPAARAAGRKRYSYYRDCGYPLQHHEV